ncbi:MAG: DUF6364 family protein [bacterium]
MNAKLTLTLDSKVIQKAKKYAIEKGISLSSVVEEYLQKLTPTKPKKQNRTTVMELKAILGKPPNYFDYREERYRYLMEKHK